MSSSPAKNLLLPWAAPALLVVTALFQMGLAKSDSSRLNPWKGGGFGMFADHHRTKYRTLKVILVTKTSIPIISSALQNLAGAVAKSQASPGEFTLEQALESQLPKTMGTPLEPIWRDLMIRSRTGPLSEAFAGHPTVFDAEFVRRLRTGERTRTLPRMLTAIGVELQSREEMLPRMETETTHVLSSVVGFDRRIESLKTLPTEAALQAFAQELRALEWRRIPGAGNDRFVPRSQTFGSTGVAVDLQNVAIQVFDYELEDPDVGPNEPEPIGPQLVATKIRSVAAVPIAENMLGQLLQPIGVSR